MAHADAETSRRMSEDRRAIAVLLVDDQRFVGAAIERWLASEDDIALHCCYRAVDAIDQANQIGPTVILQDLVLPDIDGLTLVRLFRANPLTATTPIIVLSGNDSPETRARARVEGANDFMVKLPAKSDFVACIRRHAITAAVNPGAWAAASAHDTTASGPDATQTLDRRVIAEFRQATPAGAPDFMPALIEQFSNEAASQVETLRDAQRRLDGRAVKATAHSLKGSSLTMGAGRLAALCAEIEAHMTRNPQSVCTSDLMTQVEQELVNVQHALTTELQSSIQR